MIPNNSVEDQTKNRLSLNNLNINTNFQNNNDNSLLSDRSNRGHNLGIQLQQDCNVIPSDWKNDSFDLNVSNSQLQQVRDQFNAFSKQQGLQDNQLEQKFQIQISTHNKNHQKVQQILIDSSLSENNIQQSKEKIKQKKETIASSSPTKSPTKNIKRKSVDAIQDQFKNQLSIQKASQQQKIKQKNQQSLNIESQKSLTSQDNQKSVQNKQSPPSSNATITLVGATMMSQTGGTGSSLQSHGQGSNFKQYLYVNQNTYQPHVRSVLALYQKVKQYSQKSSQNLRMYYLFFKTKLQQQKSYFDQKNIDHKIQNNELHNFVYVNAKIALNQLADSKQKQNQRGKKFLQVLKFCFLNVDNLLKQVQRNRYELQSQFELHNKILASLNKQIHKIVLSRVQKQTSTNQKDRYIQSKYVIQKEKAYLNGIYEMNRKMIKYINTCLSQQQVYIWSTVKSALTQYCKAYNQCYPGQHRFNQRFNKLLEVQNDKQLVEDLVQILQKSLPKNLIPHINTQQEGKNKLDQILIALNKQFEETIYFPIIQIQQGLTLHKTNANWTAIGKKKIEVDVIVSVDGYLHLQKDKDIATMKLKQLKIAQKGNQIVLSEKNRGMVQYIMKKPQIGRLFFEDKQELQAFIKIVMTFLKKI